MRLNITPEPAILGLLRAGPLHGYALYRMVNQEFGAVWRVSRSQLYAIVKSFEAQGWIKGQVRAQEGRPAQNILTITTAGCRAFDDWLEQPAHGLREFRVDFFLKLYFARSSGSSSAAGLVDRQIADCRRELMNLSGHSVVISSAESDTSSLVNSFRRQQLREIIRWLQKNRVKLTRPLPSPADKSSPRASRRDVAHVTLKEKA